MEKVDGVVVLYNPEDTIISNISTYLNDLEHLYVIDNSEIQKTDFAASLSAFGNCIYINNKGNKGIANALNIGAKMAIVSGAKWLLTMDQDSKFENGDFLKLCEFAEQQNSNICGIISPFHKTNISVTPVNETDEVLTIMTSGNLVNLSVYQTIGGFDEDYFIDGVDWDYCLRLNLNNFKVIRLNTVKLNHNLGNVTYHIGITKKQVMVLNYNNIRRYYITRNKLAIIFKYYKAYPEFCKTLIKSLFRDSRHILLYENDKLKKLKFMIKGIFDFAGKQMGKAF